MRDISTDREEVHEMRELKYFLIEETKNETNVRQILGYHNALNEYKRMKREHPENTYRLAIQ